MIPTMISNTSRRRKQQQQQQRRRRRRSTAVGCHLAVLVAVFCLVSAVITTNNQVTFVTAFATADVTSSSSAIKKTQRRSTISSVATISSPTTSTTTSSSSSSSHQTTLSPWTQLMGLQQQLSSRRSTSSQRNNNNVLPFTQRQRHNRLSIAEQEYERRKEEWAARYTSVSALRETFGSNRNKLWGDLDAETTRRLYKTLLPRAIMELYDSLGDNVSPEDLAQLAYKARVAAKEYARERCELIPRLGAMAFDGLRQLRRYGKFQPKGMSYDQIWEKYRLATMQEIEEELGFKIRSSSNNNGNNNNEQILKQYDIDEDDVTAKICLKIMERSCSTNESIDKWILSDDDGNNNKRHRRRNNKQHEIIHAISEQLDRDVRELLMLPQPHSTVPSFISDMYDDETLLFMSSPAFKPFKALLALT